MDRPDRMDDAEIPPPTPPVAPAGDQGGRRDAADASNPSGPADFTHPSDPAGPADAADLSDASSPSSHPDFLAQLVLSPRTGVEQGWAVKQLWELHAEPIARQVASKYRNCVAPDFVGNAFGLMWEKLVEGKYDWRRGSFKGWWRTVLTNLARDAWDASHGAVPLAEGIDPAAPAEGGTADSVLEALTDRLAEMRLALDGLSGRQELRAQVDYYAFFLIELRRALVSRLKKYKVMPGLGHLGPQWQSLRDSQVIDQLFPWAGGEALLAFRPDLNPLGDLWERLRPLIDEPPHELGAEAVCARIVSRTGEAVTRDVWYNWKRHLRRKLGEIGSLSKWEEMLP